PSDLPPRLRAPPILRPRPRRGFGATQEARAGPNLRGGVGAPGAAGGVRRRRRHGERCRRGEGGGRSDDWCDLGLRHQGASRGRGRGLPDRDARCVGATPPGAHAQYGCLRYLYTDMTAVTASPHPVTIRLSFPGYETMSPHAYIPRTDVDMSALTRINRSPSTSTPQRGRGVTFGSNPTLQIADSPARA